MGLPQSRSPKTLGFTHCLPRPNKKVEERHSKILLFGHGAAHCSMQVGSKPSMAASWIEAGQRAVKDSPRRSRVRKQDLANLLARALSPPSAPPFPFLSTFVWLPPEWSASACILGSQIHGPSKEPGRWIRFVVSHGHLNRPNTVFNTPQAVHGTGPIPRLSVFQNWFPRFHVW